MSQSQKSYPWSTLLPQEILREQLMKTDYDSLLTLCVSEDDRFPPICNNSYFWDEKLQYELETRQLTPQEFFELSARNGWTKFVAMLLTKYEIKDYLKVVSEAVKNNYWLIIKLLANHTHNEIKSRGIFQNAYLDALKYERIKIIEILKSYANFYILMRFFDDATNEEIKNHIQSGFLQNLNILAAPILVHIYNRTLDKIEPLSPSEITKLLKTINITRILSFLSEYYDQHCEGNTCSVVSSGTSNGEGIRLLENIFFSSDENYDKRISSSVYHVKYKALIRELTKKGKNNFIKILEKSEFNPRVKYRGDKYV